MQELLKKKYKLTVDFFGFMKRPRPIVFEYRQASWKELIELSRHLKTSDDIKPWLHDFLVKKTKHSAKLTPKLFNQLNSDQLVKIFEFILNTWGKNYFKKKKKTGNNRRKYSAPESSTICVLLEKTNESLDSLLEMTWEQVEFLMEGITWNLRSQTPEGKKKNEREMEMKEHEAEISDEDALRQIQNLEKQIQNVKK